MDMHRSTLVHIYIYIRLRVSIRKHLPKMCSSGEMLFFMEWVAARAANAILWGIVDTSNTIVFIGVLATGDPKTKGKQGGNIGTTDFTAS